MVDVTAINYLSEAGEWGAGIPRLENGWRITGGAVNPGADGGLANWPSQLLAVRTRILKDRVDLLSLRAAVEVTVGTAGQFASINAALAYLSERRPAYVSGGFNATIRLMPGFVMQEQVIVSGVNLGWIRIVSTDAEVQINRSYLTATVGPSARYPAFCARNGGFLPEIATLFTMMATGVGTGRDGIYVFDGGGVKVASGCGIKAAGGNGLFAQTGGHIAANGSDFRNAVECGAMIAGGTRASLQSAILTGCGTGLDAGNASTVHAAGANCGGCTDYGVLVKSAASVFLGAGNARKGSTDSNTDIFITQGGVISALGSNGGANVAPNTVTLAGIIYR